MHPEGCVNGCHECVWPSGPPETWTGATFVHNIEVSDFAERPYDLLVVHDGADKFPATADCDFENGLCERDCKI